MKNKLLGVLPCSLLITFIIVTSAFCLDLTSQAASIIGTRTISIEKKFTGLKTQAGIEINYTQNNQKSVAIISGPKEVVDLMTYTIDDNGVLEFHYKSDKNKIKGKISIELNGGSLSDYYASSAGLIRVKTPVNTTGILNFNISSSAEIIMMKDVKCDSNSLNVVVSSGGKMLFQNNISCGYCNFSVSSSSFIKTNSLVSKKFRYTASSVGTFEANSLKADTAILNVSSGAGITLGQGIFGELISSASSGAEVSSENVSVKDISLDSSSGATITLKGKAEVASLNASSGGDIILKGMNIKKIRSNQSSSGGKIVI